jgi:hypothetical protein
MYLFPASDEGKKTPTLKGPLQITSVNGQRWLRLALSKGPNKVGVSLPRLKTEAVKRFQNVVFSSYLEFWLMDKVQILGDSECYTASSEPFWFYSKSSFRMSR